MSFTYVSAWAFKDAIHPPDVLHLHCCNKPLGKNESFEAFPVGERLAFDAEEIAEIADSLLVPESVDEQFKKMKGGT